MLVQSQSKRDVGVNGAEVVICDYRSNVLRSVGRAAGILAFVLDFAKGSAATWLARETVGGVVFPSLAAVVAVLGHMHPVWLRFRGGKGVATGVGVFLMLTPIAVAFAAVIFVLVVWRWRYVSLGSIVAAVFIPLFVLLQNAFIRPVESLAPIMSAAIAGAALIVFAHRENIGRLMNGTESRFK